MKNNSKSRSRNAKDEPGRQTLQKVHDSEMHEIKEMRILKTADTTERKYENKGYYSRNGSYNGYNGL